MQEGFPREWKAGFCQSLVQFASKSVFDFSLFVKYTNSVRGGSLFTIGI